MFKKKEMTHLLKTFDHKLFFTILSLSLLPTLYTTVRIYFLGNLPSDRGFNIASQIAWVNVMYEVIQEGLILPLFYFIGKSLGNYKELENKVKTGLIISFLIYLFFSLALIFFVKEILIFMDQKEELIQKSSTYIRIESVAILLSILYKFISFFLIATKNIKYLFIILFIQMITTIILDTFLVSSLKISLQIGINGIAIGNIIVNSLLFVIGIIALRNEGINIFSQGKLSFKWQKEWLKIGGISGCESFIRNAAFILVIFKMINVVQEQDTFWVANSFIWVWLLLPVLALGELIKRNVGEDSKNATQQFSCYMLVTTLIILFWLITYPFWSFFIQNIMNISNHEKVLSVVMISIIFYIIFSYNNVVDSIFYGLGRTDLMFYQSAIINSLFYGSIFILFKMGIFTPTLNKIAIMFGIGIAFDTFITFMMYFSLIRKDRLIQTL